MKLLKFSPTSRVQPVLIMLWLTVIALIGGSAIQAIRYLIEVRTAPATAEAAVDTDTPEYRMSQAYQQFQKVSVDTRTELIKQRALGILQTANRQDQPIIWLRNHAIAAESQLKQELNRNLLYSPADLERLNKLQLDLDAYALLLLLLTQNQQSTLTPNLNLMELSRQVEGLRSLWDKDFIERRYPGD